MSHWVYIHFITSQASKFYDPSHFRRGAQQWGGIVGLALGDSAGGFADFENDENFEVKCNNLYQRIVTISRKNLIISPSLLVSSSLLHELNKPKQEQQFFQWMSRSTKIDERKRLIYCASLVKLGVCSVFQLANLVSRLSYLSSPFSFLSLENTILTIHEFFLHI